MLLLYTSSFISFLFLLHQLPCITLTLFIHPKVYIFFFFWWRELLNMYMLVISMLCFVFLILAFGSFSWCNISLTHQFFCWLYCCSSTLNGFFFFNQFSIPSLLYTILFFLLLMKGSVRFQVPWRVGIFFFSNKHVLGMVLLGILVSLLA